MGFNQKWAQAPTRPNFCTLEIRFYGIVIYVEFHARTPSNGMLEGTTGYVLTIGPINLRERTNYELDIFFIQKYRF